MTKPDKTYQGQPYWSGISKPHTRKDGGATTLVEWKSHCAECGEPFSFWRPVKKAFEPNRRCQEHQRPGIRVKPRAVSDAA